MGAAGGGSWEPRRRRFGCFGTFSRKSRNECQPHSASQKIPPDLGTIQYFQTDRNDSAEKLERARLQCERRRITRSGSQLGILCEPNAANTKGPPRAIPFLSTKNFFHKGNTAISARSQGRQCAFASQQFRPAEIGPGFKRIQFAAPEQRQRTTCSGLEKERNSDAFGRVDSKLDAVR